MEKARVVIDTNMLMVPFSCNVDIFVEIEHLMPSTYDLVVLKGTLDELEKIKTSKLPRKEREQAKMALQLVESKRKHLKIESVSAEYVDNQIVRLADASEGPFFVATQDLELRRRLKALDKNVGFIVLRQKRHLVMER